MNRQLGRTAACLAAGALLATSLVAGSASAALPANAVLFGQADIHGYGTGTEVHVGAVQTSSLKLLDLEQAFSGASTSSAGLATPITNELGTVMQPNEGSSVHAYGTGDGLELGLGTGVPSQTDANQVLLAGKVQQIAPPNTAPTTKQIGPINLPPVVTASALTGQGAAIYDTAQCPIGQPISFGLGNAANVQALSVPALAGAGNGAVLKTAGSGTTVAETNSETYLSPNGDGTWGLSTAASEDIAPITLSLLGLAKLTVTVQTAKGVDDPVTLTSQTTGESTGSVKLSSDDLVTATLSLGSTNINLATVPISNLGPNKTIPLSVAGVPVTLGDLIAAIGGIVQGIPAASGLSTLLTDLQTISGNPALTTLFNTLGSVANLSLGSIEIDTRPRAIGGSATSAPVATGTNASGALDLIKVHVGLSGSINLGPAVIPIPSSVSSISLADVAAGHLEASAHTGAPIFCSIPVTKVADPPAVTAGNPFTYTIDVPDPAKLNFIDCSLSNMTVTDVISDKPGSSPTFVVNSATAEQENSSGQLVPIPNATATITPAPGTVTTNATVQWKGLTWTLGSKPLEFVLNMSVPKSSPSGVIQDTATAVAVLTGCSGGAAGSTSASATAANGQPLTGSVTLQKPSVAALTVSPASAPSGQAKTLPFTGAMGGPWQPIAGLIALGLGGSAFALVRRSRRRRPLS